MRRASPITATLALLLASCGASDDPPPPPAPTAPARALVAVPSGWLVDPPSSPPLVVTPTSIELAERRLVALSAGRVPADQRVGGERGFLIPTVRDALAGGEGTLALAVAPSVPYRTFAEVLYSAGQAERTELVLLVSAGSAERAVPIELPRLGPGSDVLLGALGGEGDALADVLAGGAVPIDEEVGVASAGGVASPTPTSAPAPRAPVEPAEPEVTLNLSLTLTAEGVIVAGAGGRLAPGCERLQTGRGVTVPARDGAVDAAALAACLGLVHGEFPEEDVVIVSADPAVPYADVVRAIVVARGTEAAPRFPRIWLSAGIE